MRLFLSCIVLAASLAGCLSDTQETSEPNLPPNEAAPITNATAFGALVGSADTNSGQGIWVEGNLVYHTDGGGLSIWDVADLTAPSKLGEITDIGARDVDVLVWQGATYAALAGSGRGLHLVDVTDPSNPELVDTYELPSAGVHNLAALPGTPYIYSSGASGATRAIDVLDITIPHDAVVHTFSIPDTLSGLEIESDGCHDITVRPDLARAYCAGGGGTYAGQGGETFIWDITNPVEPVWLSAMDDPRIKYHHQAFVNEAANLLIINDEFIAPNCVSVDLPNVPASLDPKIPTAAAWIYDISDETAPVQMSLVQNPATTNVSPSDPTGAAKVNCGSHFGQLIPGMEAFVMGWYQGGTMLVDFTSPTDPVVMDLFNAQGSTWDAQVENGYVFHSSGDLLITPLV